MLDLFEKTTLALATTAAASPAQAPRVDVAERMRDMWRIA
jgi:hypothetical protein